MSGDNFVIDNVLLEDSFPEIIPLRESLSQEQWVEVARCLNRFGGQLDFFRDRVNMLESENHMLSRYNRLYGELFDMVVTPRLFNTNESGHENTSHLTTIVLKEKLQNLLGHISLALGALRAAIVFMPEPDKAPEVLVAAPDIDSTRIELQRQYVKGIVEQVWTSGTAIWAADALNDPVLKGNQTVQLLQIRGLGCCPLTVQSGERVGVIWIERRHKEPSDIERSLLERFGRSIAGAVDHYRGLQKKLSIIDHTAKYREKDAFKAMVGRSPALASVFNQAARLIDINPKHVILLNGPTGSGKSLLGLEIHHHPENPRRDKPFIEVNCAAIPESLIESELFGHKRGAFSGAQSDREGAFRAARGGTIFLDEIHEMPLLLQKKLKMVLETRRVKPLGSDRDEEVDFRVIAATNKSLPKLINKGEFLEDLYFRISTFELTLPGLNARLDDIEMLANYYAADATRDAKNRTVRITPNGLEFLKCRYWPGNVRELSKYVTRAAAMSSTGELTREEFLNVERLFGPYEETQQSSDTDRPPVKQQMENLQRDIIVRALYEQGWNVTKTAYSLGESRVWLHRRMKSLNISGVRVSRAHAVKTSELE